MNDNVLKVAWDWRNKVDNAGAAKTHTPSARTVVTQSLVVAAIGALFWFWLKHQTVACVLWGLAGLLLVLGFAVPKAFAAVEKAGKWVGNWLGFGATWFLLTIFFVVFLCPMRAFMKLRGKDPLTRKYDATMTSYWSKRKQPKDAEQYKRQF